MNYEYFIFLAAMAALKTIIKNPARRAQLRSVLLRLRDAITLIYEPDSHSGVMTARVDVQAFVNNAVAVHSAAITSERYAAGSFDYLPAEKNVTPPALTQGDS